MTDYAMTINTRVTDASVTEKLKAMSAMAFDSEGTLYADGAFTVPPGNANDSYPGTIVKWNGMAWLCESGEPVLPADKCGFCGANIQVVETCPRCGAPPVRKREYERGEIVVTLYESLWAKLARRVGRLFARARV